MARARCPGVSVLEEEGSSGRPPVRMPGSQRGVGRVDGEVDGEPGDSSCHSAKGGRGGFQGKDGSTLLNRAEGSHEKKTALC